MTLTKQLISFGQTCHYVTNISRKSLIYQAFCRVDIIPMRSFIPWLSLYNDLIIICVHLSKMKNFTIYSLNQTLYFHFIIGSHTACSIRLLLYNEEITIQTLLHKNTRFSHFWCRKRSSYRFPNQLILSASHYKIKQNNCYYLDFSPSPCRIQ